MSDEEETINVRVLYSSLTEPGFPEMYSDKFTYLREMGATVELVDVYENEEEEADVAGTPVIIVTQDGETKRYFDVHKALRHMAAVDAYGQTILHKIGFEEGRRIGEKLDGNRETIRETLRDVLAGRASQVSITEYRPEEADVTVEVTLKDPDPDGECDDISAFLGGLFTAVFGDGVNVVQESCMRQGDSNCRFTVAEPEDASGKIEKFTKGEG